MLGHTEDPVKAAYLKYLKQGDGPLYTFYTPYHLSAWEVPLTAARAVLFQDAAVSPLGGPVCDVLTMAKRDLKAGDVLDGIGGFDTYGMIDNAEVGRKEKLLPMGLSEGCRLRCDIAKDRAISCVDVEMPNNRLIHKLRAEQDAYFQTPKAH